MYQHETTMKSMVFFKNSSWHTISFSFMVATLEQSYTVAFMPFNWGLGYRFHPLVEGMIAAFGPIWFTAGEHA